MSTVIVQKTTTAIRCICGHLWLTASKSSYPKCPRCHSSISRKKHAVILESDTQRKLKERADSGSLDQNAAKEIDGLNYDDIIQG
jgi:phage FluMu protein Com